MKILQINNYSFNRGGAESVFFNLVSLLKSKGHWVKTLSMDFGEKNSPLVDFTIPRNEFFFNRFYSIYAKKFINEILEKEKPDIVHIHNLVGGISFSILPAIKKFKIPIVASIHDFRLLCPVGIMVNGKGEICEKCKTRKYYQGIVNSCHPGGRFKSSVVVFESYLRDFFLSHKKFFDAYLFVSNFTKQKFLEFYPELNDKAYVLYNFNLNFDDKIIRGNYFLYFGRYDREKGLFTLLNAFQQLPEYKLILLGRGEFSKKIDDFNLNKNIFDLGFKTGEDLKNIIKNSEYVIIPSECYENLPMSAVESLSLSKPIITSGLGGLSELLDNSRNGFKFELKNVKSLIKILKKSKQISDEEYEILSRNSYAFAKSNFDAESYYQKLIRIYEALIRKDVG
ncbi:MAG: glycosyltransferase [Ignavibacteria bacterium]